MLVAVRARAAPQPVLGLKWSDIDLDAGTIIIGRSRVLVDSGDREDAEVAPVVAHAALFGPLRDALERLQAAQMAEMDTADTAYANGGYVAADELGRPLHHRRRTPTSSPGSARRPGWRRSGCTTPAPRSTRSCGERRGAGLPLRAAWLGHTISTAPPTWPGPRI